MTSLVDVLTGVVCREDQIVVVPVGYKGMIIM